MASITSSPSKPHYHSSPHCPSTPTDDDSQRGRKRRRSSAAEHVSSNGSTTLRGRGRYRWPSISSLTGQQERVRKKSPERKAKKKFFGGGKFMSGLGGRDLKRGQSSSREGGEMGKENQGLVEEECGPKWRRRRSSQEARDSNGRRENKDEDEQAGENNAIEESEAESAIEN